MDTLDWFPAMSTAVPLTTCPAPSVLTVTGSGQRAIPLTTSVHVKLTRTSVLFQPAAFGGGLTTALTAGRLLSMLSVTDTLAWFPAMSTAVPLTTCPAPSVLTVTGSGQRAIPLTTSVHVKLTRTSVLFQPAAFGGGLTTALTAGRLLSMLSVTDTLAWFPAMSTAVPLTTCPAPSVLTVTGSGQRAIPLTTSVHVKLTRTSVLFQPAAFGGGLTTALTAGRLLSMLSVTDTLAWFPAMSTAVPLTTCPAPSVLTVTGSGQRAIPLTTSVHVKLTRTSVLFQPAAFGGGLTTALTAGRLLSMLSVTDTLAWFPAMSTAVPLTTCPAPSVLTVTGSGQRAIPLTTSVHVKLTRTSVLFQPAAFGGGLTTALTAGRLLSMLSVTDTLAWFPAMSTAVPLTTCPAPSVLTVTGSGQRAIPLTTSVHVKLTRTSVLFQPAAFGGGLTTALTAGRLLSMLSVTDTLAWFPAMSTAVPLTTCPAPSVLTVTGSGQRAIPLPPSVHVKLTRASVLFQPAAFGGGLTTALTAGRLLSMLSVTDTLARFPATSTAVPLTTCPAPSVLTVTGSGQRAIPLTPSVHVKLTRASVLFQPAAFGGGLTTAL